MFQLIWLLLSISERLLPTRLVLLQHYLLSSFPYVNAHVHFYPYSTVKPCHPGSLADRGFAMLRLYPWSDLSSCISPEVWYTSIRSPVIYSWLGVLPPSCCRRDFVKNSPVMNRNVIPVEGKFWQEQKPMQLKSLEEVGKRRTIVQSLFRKMTHWIR